MPPAREQPSLHSLRVLSAGLLGGVLFFLAVTLFVRPGMASATGTLDVLSYLASGWAVLSLPVASLLRAARWPSTSPDQDPEYWRKRGAAHIASIGMLEGAALLCCIAFMLNRPWWPFVAMLVPVGGMVAWFPRE